MVVVASAPSKQILVVTLWMCLSLHILGWQFALHPQVSDGSIKSPANIFNSVFFCVFFFVIYRCNYCNER